MDNDFFSPQTDEDWDQNVVYRFANVQSLLWLQRELCQRGYKRTYKVTSDKLPQVMSFEAALVGAEDYKFGNEKDLRGVEVKRNVSRRIALWVT